MEGIIMRINFDRLSQLAGLPSGNSRRGLYEGKDHEKEEGMRHRGMMEDPMREMEDDMMEDPMREMGHDDMMEKMDMDDGMDHDLPEVAFDPVDLTEDDDMDKNEKMDHGDLDEMIEIDEVMLVQELRRAKRIMQENKRRSLNESRRRDLFESQLKQVIDEEVQNVMDEMNLTGQWVYGDRRPTRSRKGYTHQGSTIPGIGFRRRR